MRCCTAYNYHRGLTNILCASLLRNTRLGQQPNLKKFHLCKSHVDTTIFDAPIPLKHRCPCHAHACYEKMVLNQKRMPLSGINSVGTIASHAIAKNVRNAALCPAREQFCDSPDFPLFFSVAPSIMTLKTSPGPP